MAGLLWSLPPSVFSLIRAVSLSLANLAVAVFSYRLGRRELTPFQTGAFVALLVAFLAFVAAGLMLAPAMAMFLVAVGVFTVTRGRLPIATICLAAVIFFPLHAGKKVMREEYWVRGQGVQPWDFPEYYARWFVYGFERIPQTFSGDPTSKSKQTSLVERSSVVQMLLLVQAKSPGEKSFLYGRSYAIIPELLIPRILNSNKIWSHEGTYILSIHYALQTRKASRRTTIGFGLLPEAYANFGYLGVVGLALVLGAGCGLVTRWSMHVPMASLRGLFSLLVLALVIQTEHTAGVIVSSLFQGGMTLIGFSLLTMKTQTLSVAPPVSPARPLLQRVVS